MTNSEPKLTKRACPTCGHEMEIKVGVGNFKNLFKKPTMSEMIVFFCMIMLVVAAWAYQHDTKVCRDTMANIENVCLQYNMKPVENTSLLSHGVENLSFNFTLPSEVVVYKNVSMNFIRDDENKS